MDQPRNKAALKIVLSILLLGCLLDMEYGYFQMIRFVGMVGFILLALSDTELRPLIYVWIGSAILINPFIKIALGRTIWNVVDVIWVLILIGSIFLPHRPKPPEESPDTSS